jgi:cell shape-determining protein MreC
MNYLSSNKKRNTNQFKKTLLAVLVCLVVTLVAKSFLVRNISSASQMASAVVSKAFPNGFRNNRMLLDENNSLREQIINLQAEVVEKKVLEVENVRLKYIFGRNTSQASSSKKTLAIITQNPDKSLNDVFMLDVGAESKVVLDNKVMFGAVILGKIVEVGNGYSKAELFSAPGNKFKGIINRTNINLDAEGMGGGVFVALVPLGADVVVGDTFILPSITPKVYGVIKSIEEQKSEGFKKLVFTLPMNPNAISEVLISK